MADCVGKREIGFELIRESASEIRMEKCEMCGSPSVGRCLRCRKTAYCSRECRRLDWAHREKCQECFCNDYAALAVAVIGCDMAQLQKACPKCVNRRTTSQRPRYFLMGDSSWDKRRQVLEFFRERIGRLDEESNGVTVFEDNFGSFGWEIDRGMILYFLDIHPALVLDARTARTENALVFVREFLRSVEGLMDEIIPPIRDIVFEYLLKPDTLGYVTKASSCRMGSKNSIWQRG
jgi:hypothetical protein